MQYENEARVFFTAKSENEGFARLFAAGFLTQLDPTISEMTDVKTAVSEAVTNAIIHGYEEKGLSGAILRLYRQENLHRDCRHRQGD